MAVFVISGQDNRHTFFMNEHSALISQHHLLLMKRFPSTFTPYRAELSQKVWIWPNTNSRSIRKLIYTTIHRFSRNYSSFSLIFKSERVFHQKWISNKGRQMCR